MSAWVRESVASKASCEAPIQVHSSETLSPESAPGAATLPAQQAARFVYKQDDLVGGMSGRGVMEGWEGREQKKFLCGDSRKTFAGCWGCPTGRELVPARVVT